MQALYTLDLVRTVRCLFDQTHSERRLNKEEALPRWMCSVLLREWMAEIVDPR